MTWKVLAGLIILWAIGYATDLSGRAIHLLLVVAAIVFVVRLVSGRGMAYKHRVWLAQKEVPKWG